MSHEPLTIGMRVHVVDGDAPLAYLSRDDVQFATRPHVGDRILPLRIGLEIVSGEVTITAVEQYASVASVTPLGEEDPAPQTWAIVTVQARGDFLDSFIPTARETGWHVQVVPASPTAS